MDDLQEVHNDSRRLVDETLTFRSTAVVERETEPGKSISDVGQCGVRSSKSCARNRNQARERGERNKVIERERESENTNLNSSFLVTYMQSSKTNDKNTTGTNTDASTSSGDNPTTTAAAGATLPYPLRNSTADQTPSVPASLAALPSLPLAPSASLAATPTLGIHYLPKSPSQSLIFLAIAFLVGHH